MKKIKTCQDIINFIQKNNLQDHDVILGVEGYNTDQFIINNKIYKKNDSFLMIQVINNKVVICDNNGSYKEELEG